MSYLRRHDFAAHVREDELETLAAHPNALQQSIDAAIEQARSYIGYHYDADSIFLNIEPWDPTATYSSGVVVSLEAEEWKPGNSYDSGDLVQYDGKVYESGTNGNEGNNPETSSEWDKVGKADTIYVSNSDNNTSNPDSSDWDQKDPRHGYLKMVVMDCAMVHLYSMTQPDNLPEHRMQRKEEGKEWLEKIANAELTANLPERKPDDDQADESPKYGNFPSRNWNF